MTSISINILPCIPLLSRSRELRPSHVNWRLSWWLHCRVLQWLELELAYLWAWKPQERENRHGDTRISLQIGSLGGFRIKNLMAKVFGRRASLGGGSTVPEVTGWRA